jgi:hypothetical protein
MRDARPFADARLSRPSLRETSLRGGQWKRRRVLPLAGRNSWSHVAASSVTTASSVTLRLIFLLRLLFAFSATAHEAVAVVRVPKISSMVPCAIRRLHDA